MWYSAPRIVSYRIVASKLCGCLIQEMNWWCRVGYENDDCRYCWWIKMNGGYRRLGGSLVRWFVPSFIALLTTRASELVASELLEAIQYSYLLLFTKWYPFYILLCSLLKEAILLRLESIDLIGREKIHQFDWKSKNPMVTPHHTTPRCVTHSFMSVTTILLYPFAQELSPQS